jgi:exonuclease III
VEDTSFKLWYTGMAANKNGVGILINKSLKSGVVDVKRCGDRIILVKLVFVDLILNVISVYAPQVGLNENTKREFQEGLKDLVRSVSSGKKLFIGGDLNGHMGASNIGFEGAHGGFGYGMIVADTLFEKR